MDPVAKGGVGHTGTRAASWNMWRRGVSAVRALGGPWAGLVLEACVADVRVRYILYIILATSQNSKHLRLFISTGVVCRHYRAQLLASRELVE